MNKKDLKTGMTCQIVKGNQYMIYINPENEISLIPINTISTIDKNGEYKRLGLNLSTIICLKTDMNENLIENKIFQHGYGFNEELDPFQITKIWHSKNPCNLFSFEEDDLIWKL